MYRRVSQRAPYGIHDTRSRSIGGELAYATLPNPIQEQPSDTSPETQGRCQVTEQRLDGGSRPRPVCPRRSKDTCQRAEDHWNRNSYWTSGRNLWTHSTSEWIGG